MIVSVIYRLEPGQKFDVEYYMNSHIPLVASRLEPLGLKSAKVLHGIGSPGGAAAAKRQQHRPARFRLARIVRCRNGKARRRNSGGHPQLHRLATVDPVQRTTGIGPAHPKKMSGFRRPAGLLAILLVLSGGAFAASPEPGDPTYNSLRYNDNFSWLANRPPASPDRTCPS